MDRKPQQRAVESRKKLIESALLLFSTKGYYNTNMREISRTAGLSTGIFYHYFENKESLYMTLIEEYLKESYEMMKQIVAVPDRVDSKEEAEIELKKMMNYLFERAGSSNALLADVETLKKTIDGLEDVMNNGLARITKCIEDYLREHYKEKDMHYEVMARMIYVVTDTVSGDVLKEENVEVRAEYGKVFVREILHYLYEL